MIQWMCIVNKRSFTLVATELRLGGFFGAVTLGSSQARNPGLWVEIPLGFLDFTAVALYLTGLQAGNFKRNK